jgi:UDP-N-acetylmuramate dehydrogenase
MNPVIERRVYDSLSESYPGMPKYDVGCDRVKIPAAWLIEQCGWKGKTMGRAGVHQRQPLVLVNTGGASGADIKALSDRIMDDVMQKFGIRISPEVNFI